MSANRTLLALFAVALGAGDSPAASPELVSVKRVWGEAPHSAFTDLARWRGRWYLTFREASAHVGGTDGVIRVLESPDGDAWSSTAVVREEGVDLRDPKLSVTPDDRLMLLCGGSVYEGKSLKSRQPRVCFSADGRKWSAPRRVLEPGEWLWRVTWHGGTAYGASYSTPGGKDAEWRLTLFASEDGTTYRRVARLDVPGHPNETTLRVLPDGRMLALVRREAGGASAWVGTSRAPFTEWTWHDTGRRVGGPNFLRLPDGTLWAAGRNHEGGVTTALGRLTDHGYTPELTLPSRGDSSYPGLVWHDGLLWMSYYASHEGKAAVYLAKVRLPLEAEDVGTRLEPFVDDALLDRLSGSARLQVKRPEPAEVVLTADRPWEGNTSAYVTLFADGDRFRMYYRGGHFDVASRKEAHREVTCYAESRDGIHWERPELGLFSIDGSTRNNIVWDGPGTHNFTPFLDTNPACPPESRYKALAVDGPGLIAFRSADGTHWSRMTDRPVITKGAFDSQNLAFWDAHARRYREYHRGFRGVRAVMTSTSDDFLHWSDPVFVDLPGSPPEHLYTNAVQPYFRAPHVLVGFPTRFLPATEQTEPTFMASRDGQTFRRSTEAVIPTTAPADRSGNRCNYMTWGVLSLPGRGREVSVYATEAYYTGPGTRVRRFVYRLDGFSALQADTNGGEALTRPLQFGGDQLTLNARVAPGGSLKVELTDPDGKPLPGHSLAECDGVSGDEVATPVRWRGGAGLESLRGKSVRVRLALRDAEVYSFRFGPREPNDRPGY